MSRLRYDETEDQVDLLADLDAIDRARVRVLTLVHHGVDAEQETFVWTLDGSVDIGRDPGDDGIELLDPGASRRHARIVYDEARDAFAIEDLGSRNGTIVDGTRQARAELVHGTVFRIASSVFVFADAELPPDAIAPTPSPEVSIVRAIAEARADLAAKTDLSILVVGPTGAGKDVMARRVHASSGRRGALVPVNCGALNRELIASELFGHVAGAFSGAKAERAGLFVTADGGTLFLDEIGDLPLDQQPALLRTLQDKRVRPVGTDAERSVDVRVVAATHQPLEAHVEDGRFRRDLFARLAGVVIDLPGIAERREEILPFFFEASGVEPGALSTDAAEALVLHDWPQNVREIQQVGAQVKLYAKGGPVDSSALPAHFAERLSRLRRAPRDVGPESLDRDGLIRLLQVHDGNVATIAKALGKHRAQVYRWLRREGLDPDDFRPSA